jgi:CRISPR-associated exonuclease Cas4
MDTSTSSIFTVTDIKEMAYCPRIVYYRNCLPAVRPPPTIKMQMGAAANDQTAALEHRRSLRAYQLDSGERSFDVWLESAALGLNGRLDMLIARPDEAIPVDFKDSRWVARAHLTWEWQLTAYALLLEEQPGPRVQRGFIYSIPARRAKQVDITPELKETVRAQLAGMREMVLREWMPEATTIRARCAACEYRRFCNDV